MNNKDIKFKIAVLAGGISAEREVSLQSGKCVADALARAGHDVLISDIGPKNLGVLDDKTIDVFFIALHGTFGEDGDLQEILEDRSLTYTGCGPKASRLAFDKAASKRLFLENGIQTPRDAELDESTDKQAFEKQVFSLGERIVIKPSRQGSSVGITITDDLKHGLEAAHKTFEQYGPTLAEEFIAGRELTVGVLSSKALPIVEVRPKTAFYDYHAKYIDDGTDYLFDTIEDIALAEKIQAAALKCFNALGCKDFARVDFILADNNQFYALEVNTIPGFTTHSLLPMAAKQAGLNMGLLCERIILAAIEEKKPKSPTAEINEDKLEIAELGQADPSAPRQSKQIRCE
jgi:D-alanine-D-alanine ligase